MNEITSFILSEKNKKDWRQEIISILPSFIKEKAILDDNEETIFIKLGDRIAYLYKQPMNSYNMPFLETYYENKKNRKNWGHFNIENDKARCDFLRIIIIWLTHIPDLEIDIEYNRYKRNIFLYNEGIKST